MPQVAIKNEVMVAISNLNYAMPGGMLTTWIEGIKRAGVKNAMVVALDDHTKRMAEEHGLTAHEMHLEVGTDHSTVCKYCVYHDCHTHMLYCRIYSFTGTARRVVKGTDADQPENVSVRCEPCHSGNRK